MNWTDEKPTNPGWYWWRRTKELGPEPLLLEQMEDGLVHMPFGRVLMFVRDMDGQWSSVALGQPEE